MLVSLCLDSRRSWPDVSKLAHCAEDAGLTRVYLPDHFMPYHETTAVSGGVLESWTCLSALAVTTTKIGLGALVLGNSYRHPAVVANMAATLDHVSGGRLLLGLGAGSQPNEHQAYGIELLSPPRRLGRLEEALEVITALLRSEVATFDGRYYRLERARCEPAPVQRPLPLLVAGAGERRSIPLAARFGDAWHAWTTPAEFRRKSGILEAALAELGRPSSEIARLTGQVLLVVDRPPDADDDPDIVGDAEFVTGRLADYRDAGVDEFIVRDHAHTPITIAMESVAQLADQVLPALTSPR